MGTSLLAVALTFVVTLPILARDSFVYHATGMTVANGVPVNVKMIKARYSAPFFWFTRGDRQYLVTDRASIERVRAIYAPLFAEEDQLAWAGEQRKIVEEQRRLAKEQLEIGLEPRDGERVETANRRVQLHARQNQLAMRLNELARLQRRRKSVDVNATNEEIEQKLEVLAAEFVRTRKARAR